MIIKSEKGFTLVELLVSIVVLVVVGVITTSVISTSLRGSNKANNIEIIRQSGDYALNQISKDITYAQTFDGVNTGFDNPDPNAAQKYFTSCPSSPLTGITVQSASGLIKYVCDGTTLTANDAALITDTSSVSLTNCTFTCTQTDVLDVPIIGISFMLSPKTPSGLAENNNNQEIPFQTSITLRNYRK